MKNMINGLVSVVTPTFNCGKYIGKTLESIINQTYNNLEVIVVDDCSMDNTCEVVNYYLKKDNRIKYFRLGENSGAAVARSIAIEKARGEFIAFLDSDDIWYRDKLEKQLEFMRTNNVAFTCTAYEQMDEHDNSLNKIITPPSRISYNRLLLDCPVGNSTVVYSVAKMGKFKVPNIRKRNDDALWLQMLKKEPCIYGINEVLARYRIRNNAISSNKLDLIKYHWFLYRKIEHLSIVRSLFHIVYWCLIKILKIK